MSLEETIEELQIKPFSQKAAGQAQEKLDGVAKPLDGLGYFEDILCRIAGMQSSADIDISKRIVVMMCADNGIVEEGISQSSYDVTASVAVSMSLGNSSVCRMAERAHADTLPVDIGIRNKEQLSGYTGEEPARGDNGHYRLLKLCADEIRGTENFLKTPAMTEERLAQALTSGMELAGRLCDMGYRLICTGEMGIGNTTTSAAVAASLLRKDPDLITGRGAGLDEERLIRKREVIKQAIGQYHLYKAGVYEVLRTVGGYDIAGLTGLFLGGAVYGVPVVIDGCISATAALCAVRMRPECRDYMLASHKGSEKGTEMILDELGLTPVLDTDMKLGEGTGAVMLIPLIDMALAVYDSNVTFEDISVERYERYTRI